MNNKIISYLFVLVSISMISCGTSTFQGDSRIDQYGEPSLDSQEQDGLTWFWGCDGSYSQEDTKLNGEGSFVVSRSLHGATLRFKGDSCLGSKVSRDIVFVVDVSNSMNYISNGNPASDPMVSGSCGRLQAVEKAVSSIISRKEDASFAILTFSDRVVDRSNKFFTSQKDLYQDLVSASGMSSVASILCNADGGTDYDLALKGAKNLFDYNARAGARHEIYFISDGEPWPDTATGEEVARSLRNEGTIIGTLMLAHLDDSVLKNKIASTNSSGGKLHANVSKVENLTSALSSLINTDIVKAEIQYRSLSGNEWKRVDVSDKISGSSYDFVTPIKFTPRDYPSGMEVVYTYWDVDGNNVVLRGQVSWKD